MKILAAPNYIYIVLAIFYIIYSIVKAAKKNQNKPAAPASPSQKKDEFKPVTPPAASPLPKQNPGDDLKKMLEEVLGKTSPIKIPQLKPQSLPVKKQPAKSSPLQFKKEKAVISRMPAKSTPKKEPHTFLPSEHIVPFQKTELAAAAEEEPVIDFDLRQAIIYSEILKRPQY